MKRKEYMEQLSKALEGIDAATASEIMEDYEAHFERAKEAGRSEEEVIDELGSIDEFVQELGQFVKREELGQDVPEAKSVVSENAEKAQPEAEKNIAEEKNTAQENSTAADKAEENHAGENKAETIEVVSGEVEDPEDDMDVETEQTEYHREYKWGQNRSQSYADEQSTEEFAQDEQSQDAGFDEKSTSWWKNINIDVDTEKYVKKAEQIGQKTVKVVAEAVDQLSGQFDKAFGKFSNWFSNYEKSGENAAANPGSQEAAKENGGETATEAAENAEQTTDTVNAAEDNSNAADTTHATADDWESIPSDSEQTADESPVYRYNGMKMTMGEEKYTADCDGVLAENEGIRNVEIEARNAEVRMLPSTDNMFHYKYINEGNAGSKLVYRLDQRRSRDTLHLSIGKNEELQKKNHFSILGGVFDETSDLTLEIQVPEWMNSVSCNGKSGDITVNDVNVRQLKLKNLSGEIKVSGTHGALCSADTASGDVEVARSEFEQLVAASKSGSAQAIYVKVQKADIRSMSGDADVKYIDAEQVTVSSMSGDSYLISCNAETAAVSSMSGDSFVENVDCRNLKVSTVSGDVEAKKSQTQNVILASTSGDVEANQLFAERLSVSSTSGDMDLSGSFNEMELKNGSGDVTVVQEGNTRARINARSGDVEFALKNKNGGFIANLRTHGDIDFDYNGLNLSEAASGEHRYGAEQSILDFALVSGDISITD